MIKGKAVIYLFLVVLLVSLASAQSFSDRGFGGFGGGTGPGGFGFISGFYDNYSEWFDFFIYFVIFFVVGHWAFGKRGKGDTLAVVIGIALAFALIRWQTFSGISLITAIADLAGGLFGSFIGLIFIVLLILLFLAVLKSDNNGTKVGAGIAYIVFFLWFGSEGGYYFSDFFYYFGVSPYFVAGLLQVLFYGSLFIVVIFGYKWMKEGK